MVHQNVRIHPTAIVEDDVSIGAGRKGATIGANCTIGNNLNIGQFAMVGMGAVVTKSVEDFQMVIGVPAKAVAVVCRCGHPLHYFNETPMAEGQKLDCELCGWKFEATGLTVKDLGSRTEAKAA